MRSKALQYIALFIGLLLLQILLFDNVEIAGFLSPYIYPLFILLLPIEFAPVPLLTLAFFQGLTIDFFSSSLGLHAAANTFMAFIRPYALRPALEAKKGSLTGMPTTLQLGVARSARYTVTLILAHHLLLYFLAAFTLHHFWHTLLQALANTILSAGIILIAQILVFRPDTKNRKG